jgi:hypothetical protein
MHRALWLDESALALNITTRSYSHLVGNLNFDQSAPVGYLFLEKIALDLFGDSERALRLPAFLAGLLALGIFWKVALRFVDRTAALLALAMFAVLEPFVYYSAEVKPYGFDVLITLVLAWLFVRVLEAPTVRRLAELGVFALVSIWFSHPSVFVLAGIGCTVIGVAAIQGNRRVVALGCAAALVWIISFGGQWGASIRHQHHLESGAVGAAGTKSSSIVKNLYVIFSDPGQLPRTLVGLSALLGAAGLIVMVRRTPARPVMIAIAIIAAAVADLLHKYPLGKRWELFLFPFAVFLVAQGIVSLYRATRPPLRLVVVAAGAVMLLAPAATAAKHLDRLPQREPTGVLLADVYRHWQAGDTLYVSVYSQYPFRYYLRCHDCNALAKREAALWPFRDVAGATLGSPAIAPTTKAVVLGGPQINLPGYVADFEKLRGRRRVWLLFSHVFPASIGEIQFQLDVLGRLVADYSTGSSSLFLYDFTKPGEPSGRYP